MKIKIFILLFIIATLSNYLIQPKLPESPFSYAFYDTHGILLGAHISSDGQWRFSPSDSIPARFKSCITTFEDKRFSLHHGFDHLAFLRAFWLNIKHFEIKSGGSTITMQTIRLARKGKPRTIKEKLVEIFLASRLESKLTKNEILIHYCANAPFGGNTVGLEAAAWRYFKREPNELSWAESALLAVLPNSPSLIHPGKNRNILKHKRDLLLEKLLVKNVIDSTEFELSILEPIPEKPNPFPQTSYHLLHRAIKENRNNSNIFHSTINENYQKRINSIVLKHHKRLKGNDINNIAVVVLEVDSGDCLAYIGNIPNLHDETHHNLVDVINAPRSTGSILKPFLYASMLSSGEILPYTLVPDIPTFFGGYYPKNFNMGYDGAVKANRSLVRSLNIPAVKMLQDFGIEKFHSKLKQLGLTTVHNSPSHYGLSLILGGIDGTLWDICGVYASMARSLKTYTNNSAQYTTIDYSAPKYIKTEINEPIEFVNEQILSAAAIWHTFNTMLDVERPIEESEWKRFSSNQKIAWKTGTSFGFRDAWAIGLNSDYVVGVWVGNADGEGRPELIGIRAAAPILFDIFKILPKPEKWFEPPYDDMEYTATCSESGYLPNPDCNTIDSIWIPNAGIHSDNCPYHKIIHLDKDEEFIVKDNCYSTHKMKHKSWFILPPVIEWYYKKHDANYKILPPIHPNCKNQENEVHSMQVIYPPNLARIYVPIELDGTEGKSIFEVAHRTDTATIFWYIDDLYIATTKSFHQIAIKPDKGKHQLTIIDGNGEILVQNFEILSK